jgi:myo-inositol 2-dehydrogenase/D-chiro-inositol 1-dehydrogenase
MARVTKPEKRLRVTRREFVDRLARAAAAGLVFPTIIPASALGRDGAVAPTGRINLGCIGVGERGRQNLKSFLDNAEVRVVAVCDVDRRRAQDAKALVDRTYSQPGSSGFRNCAAYDDFRRILERTDIDAVMIAAPDHWHAIMAITAMRTGKDVYCEAPLSLTISEGRAIADYVRRYDRVFQTGSQRRSDPRFRFACELVKNGLIGKVGSIRVTVPTGPVAAIEPASPVPEGFDYDMWLGPAPWQPYTPKRCQRTFRYISDYAGGTLTDVGAHFFDLAQWANFGEEAGPVSVEGEGVFPTSGLFDTAVHVRLEFVWADGTRLSCVDQPAPSAAGVRFEGETGWVEAGWEATTAEPASLLKHRFSPGDKRLYASSDHYRNFLDCVRTRVRTVAPAEAGHRAATVCHLGGIAMLLGRKLQWNPKSERFVNDPLADRLLTRSMRSPWALS